MRPASLLRVEWVGGPLLRPGHVVLMVDAASCSLVRSMQRRLIEVEGVLWPTFVTDVAVPCGPVTLTAMTEAAATVWRRQIDAVEAQQRVRVDASSDR